MVLLKKGEQKLYEVKGSDYVLTITDRRIIKESVKRGLFSEEKETEFDFPISSLQNVRAKRGLLCGELFLEFSIPAGEGYPNELRKFNFIMGKDEAENCKNIITKLVSG